MLSLEKQMSDDAFYSSEVNYVVNREYVWIQVVVEVVVVAVDLRNLRLGVEVSDQFYKLNNNKINS